MSFGLNTYANDCVFVVSGKVAKWNNEPIFAYALWLTKLINKVSQKFVASLLCFGDLPKRL
ncbi:MAG: hypothetical protein NZ805_01130 [Armatimonadetes bacterium]|nr:hypothetical protein [Armatimonadota bacterium]MDW8027484.1 hypothetical protein [Armatimonadota bacterium]